VHAFALAEVALRERAGNVVKTHFRQRGAGRRRPVAN